MQPPPRRDYGIPDDCGVVVSQRYMMWRFPPPPEVPASRREHRPTGSKMARREADPLTPASKDEKHQDQNCIPTLDPPQCFKCSECRWPVHRNRKGNFMCSDCAAPINGRPICIWCDKLTWDGMCTGKGMCSQGRFFICRECYIAHAEAPGPSPDEWSAWFREREAKFPLAFADGGPTASSGRGSGPSPQDAGQPVHMSCFEEHDSPEELPVHPPECTTCKQFVWPAMKSKSGKWHCGFCKPPPKGRPECSKCNILDWDGLSPRGTG